MTLRSTDTRWGVLNKLFHWSLFLLVVAIIVAVNMAEAQPKGSDAKAWWMVAHRSLGLTAMMVMLAWVILKPWLGRPHPYGALWQTRLATLVHWGMILLIIGMPIAGLLMSQFAQKPVSVFGCFDIPVVLAENEKLAGIIYGMHTRVAAPLLVGLVGLHVAGALWHHFFDKDETLKRMLR